MEKSNLTEIKLGAPSSIEEGASPKANFSLDKGVRLTNIKLDDEDSKCTKEGALKTFTKILLVWKEKGFEYVEFEDPEVLRVLLANGVGDRDGITMEELKAVTNMGSDGSNWFRNNTNIRYFNELKYCTKLVAFENLPFHTCPNVEEVDLSNIRYSGHAGNQNILCGSKIRVVNLSKYEGSTGWGNGMFMNCKQLIAAFFGTDIYRQSYSNTEDNLFTSDTKLRLVDMKGYSYDSSSNMMSGCKSNYINFIYRKDEPTKVGFGVALKNIFVKESSLSTYKESWNTLASIIYPISGYEWQIEMQSIAAEEDKTLDSIHEEFPEYSNVGWDYEYIDYLIYGVEPPKD